MLTFEKNSVTLKGEDAKKFCQYRKDVDEGRAVYTETTYKNIDTAMRILSGKQTKTGFWKQLRLKLTERVRER